jgi:signal transduction histidine kinase
VVPDISSPPDQAARPVPGPAPRRLSQVPWSARPDLPDLIWALLWLLGVGCIVLYCHWNTIPFHYLWLTLALVMFAMLMRYAHRRQRADIDTARASGENARLLAAQREFFQDASHQLRTPITIALGHAELLARELTDGQRSRDIHLVVSELTRLKSLAERLLLIATSENPDFLRPEPIELNLFAADVLRRWRPAADRRWRLGRLDAVTVCADRERLGLALDALLENAVQHTAPNDRIRLSVRHAGPLTRLIVEDTGSGIAWAELGHIFDRFRSGSPRGTGLGLALARAIARGHGGEVLVRSAKGTGSTFEFVLPAQTGAACETPDQVPAQAGDPCRPLGLC